MMALRPPATRPRSGLSGLADRHIASSLEPDYFRLMSLLMTASARPVGTGLAAVWRSVMRLLTHAGSSTAPAREPGRTEFGFLLRVGERLRLGTGCERAAAWHARCRYRRRINVGPARQRRDRSQPGRLFAGALHHLTAGRVGLPAQQGGRDRFAGAAIGNPGQMHGPADIGPGPAIRDQAAERASTALVPAQPGHYPIALLPIRREGARQGPQARLRGGRV